MFNKAISPWILAGRPKTILASIGPVLIGLSWGFYLTKKCHLIIAFLTLMCALLLQLATNIANDYLDFKKGIDGEDRLGPLRVTSAGLLPPLKMKMALIFLLSLAFMLGLYLMFIGGLFIVIIGLLSLYFAYGYTGGPYPLSYHGLGEISAFLFFGIVAVSGTTYLQTHVLEFWSLFLGASVGLISAAILGINNLRDINSDKKTMKKTLAVMIGPKAQKRLILSCLIMSLVSFLILAFYFHSIFLLGIFTAVPFITYWKKIYTTAPSIEFNIYLAKTAQYLFLYSIFISFTFVTLKWMQ